MHFQANLKDGSVVTGEAALFSSLPTADVDSFQIVSRHVGFCVSIWEMTGCPLAYVTRQTPNETVHVMQTQAGCVFIFEGTGDIVQQTEWGSGIFEPI